MDFKVKKDKRNGGNFFHKSKGIKNIAKTRKFASKDITKYCEFNYINIEPKVLQLCSCFMKIYRIDTNRKTIQNKKKC